MSKLDGCGNLISPESSYYIQDVRQYEGNSIVFWKHEGHGYTANFQEAGIFMGSDSRVHSDRTTDVPWPVGVVRACRSEHVDAQRLLKHKRG